MTRPPRLPAARASTSTDVPVTASSRRTEGMRAPSASVRDEGVAMASCLRARSLEHRFAEASQAFEQPRLGRGREANARPGGVRVAQAVARRDEDPAVDRALEQLAQRPAL